MTSFDRPCGLAPVVECDNRRPPADRRRIADLALTTMWCVAFIQHQAFHSRVRRRNLSMRRISHRPSKRGATALTFGDGPDRLSGRNAEPGAYTTPCTISRCTQPLQAFVCPSPGCELLLPPSRYTGTLVWTTARIFEGLKDTQTSTTLLSVRACQSSSHKFRTDRVRQALDQGTIA